MADIESYIEVAVALPVYQTYVYQVPDNLFIHVSEGKRVLVPFGRRRVTGYVLGPDKSSDEYTIKRILDVLDETPLFPSDMVSFFKWISNYYVYPIGEVIKGEKGKIKVE